MTTFDHGSDLSGLGLLSIALIGPHERNRKAVANALIEADATMIREFNSYPPELADVTRMLEKNYDVVIIDLDSDQKFALDLVENVVTKSQATVMVYSSQSDPAVLMQCMRAGAREFLAVPIDRDTLTEALARASTRRPTTQVAKERGGKLLVFMGSKGGTGVTTVACNFAVMLAQECAKSTLLIDLDLPLGDTALNLGISSQFSTVDALQNSNRLDSNFLSKLLTKHSSGLSVLAAPGKFPQVEVTKESIERLVGVARTDFDYVVLDAGSRFDFSGAALLKQAETVYLVMQAGIPELRNSHRVISEYFKSGGTKLEVVLNRFMPRSAGLDEEHIEKALSRPVQWKIPSDFLTVRRMQNEAVPLAMEDSAISRAIREMARTACGMSAKPEKKKGFSLFG
jgi:pilus assembly protein CpaE